MVPLFPAIILDVIVLSLILMVIVISVVKGFMHTLVNFILLAGSVALGFSPYVDFVKIPVVEFMADKINLGAGVLEEAKLGLYLAYPFIASFAISLVLYFILRLFKLLILVVSKRRMRIDNRLPKRPSKVSRIFGGLFGLILYGVVIVAALSTFNKPLIGGDKTIKQSYVVKYIEMGDDLAMSLFIDKDDFEKVEDMIIVKLIKTNLYEKVTNENVEDMNVLTEIVANKGLEVESLDNVKEKIRYMHHFLRFITSECLNDKGEELELYHKVIESTKNMSTKLVNEFNALHGETLIPIDAGANTLAISQCLRKLGLNEVVTTFEKVFVIK